jgi:hypothetical protein
MMRHYRLILLTLLLSACSLSSGGQSNHPPSVQIAQGIGSAPYREGVFVNLQAVIINTEGEIASVEFAIDNRVLSEITEPNAQGLSQFVVTEQWQAEGIGTRVLRITATRRDGTRGEATASLTVIAADSPQEGLTPQINPTATQGTTVQPTTSGQQPPPTVQSPPTQPPTQAPSTTGQAQAVFDRLQNVRSGPGTEFTRIGTMNANDRAIILAVNTNGEWYKIRFGTGEGWVYAPYVSPEGNVAALPREVGPATPVPLPTAFPTAIIPTATPEVQLPNLTITDIGIFVPSDGSVQPKCGIPFTARVTIRNVSDVPTSTGLTLMQNVHVATNTVNGSSGTGLVAVNIGPNGTHTVEYTFTIDTFVGEEQRIEFIADAGNEVVESNESDNRNSIIYMLASGSC